MADLKPCPFCKDGGKPERHSMEHFVGNPSNGIVEMDDWVTCMICGASADTHVWNTRHERICKMKVSPGTAWSVCDNCGAFVYSNSVTNATNNIPVRHCPNCGARVVE